MEVFDEASSIESPPRKKRRTNNNSIQNLSESELLQLEHEKLKTSSSKQIRTLSAKIQKLQENAGELEATLERANRKNAVLEKTVEKLQRQIKSLKSTDPKDKAKYSSLKVDTKTSSPQPKKKRGRPCMFKFNSLFCIFQ